MRESSASHPSQLRCKPRLFVALATAACNLLIPRIASGDDDLAALPASIDDIEDVSLQDLMSMEVQVATPGTQRALRDTPGIVTVITRDEIERLGFRDLLDLLRSVVGFQFSTDSFSTNYAGVRGLWGAEGKTKVLLDGHDMAELLYAMTVLGNRIPPDWIERVEVIRGPGSVAYGGAAELAVINIVTRGASSLNGLAVSGVYGQTLHGMAADGVPFGQAYARRNLSLQWGRTFENLGGLRLEVGAFVGQGQRSDLAYTDVNGDSYSMAGQSDVDPMLLRIKAEWKGLVVRYLFERYLTTQRDLWGENAAQAFPTLFITSSLAVQYSLHVSDKLTVTPMVSHSRQQPWVITEEAARAYPQVWWDPVIDRLGAGVLVNYVPIRNYGRIQQLSLTAAAEYTHDWTRDEEYGFAVLDNPDETTTTVSYHNYGAFLQGLLDTTLINAVAGARIEHHSRFGNSFVPRGGVQKDHGWFRYKLFASQAFRAPSVMNLAYTPDVTPEKTTVFEGEAGLSLAKDVALTLNLFDITIHDPIVYYWDAATNEEGYVNRGQTGSRGFELELRFRRHGSHATLGYGYHAAAGKNQIGEFQPPWGGQSFLGFAQHQLTFVGATDLTSKLSVGVSGSVLSDRYGYGPNGADGQPRLETFGPEVMLNTFIRYKDFLQPGFWIALGGYNLLDVRPLYIQPYAGGHPPLPGTSAEILLKIGYESGPRS